MESREAELFKALGVESRIKIINALRERGPLGVNQLAKELGITPAAVSQHLKVLKLTGLVRSERKGYSIPYDIDHDALEHCQEVLSKVCACGCRGKARARKGPRKAAHDSLTLLRKYEQELRRELEAVLSRIHEIERKA
ncbi:MAG: ArsR family transcriptional regulator [Candidatus Abyssobacteria bacterium SURF_5]|uniref:ArsR family transcriptional regulator n=1 Tax=Abyssobacteria bacterium (strain SURF_5) TaxID=2093360 RepID=A0A3A4NNX6_ABYX5|nr:MAG: ArsR family transcriptional regulator [Candidatus Abyssubacteria bacterium SURF_5]